MSFKSILFLCRSNDLVNEKPDQPYTLNQLKLICHLISHIKPTDTNFETKEVLLSELGFDSIDSYNNRNGFPRIMNLNQNFIQKMKTVKINHKTLTINT